MTQPTRPNQSGSTVLYVTIIMLVVMVIGLVGLGLKRRHDRQLKTAAAAVQTTPTVATSTSTPAPSSNGTDNQSLANDLNGINSLLSQGSQNLSSANTAVGDQTQQVTVPTN